MSTATPPKASPLAPPNDVFWEKYSPHYEFPLSSVGSVAMHIGALALFLGALWMLSRMSIQDTTPVQMRAMQVSDDGDGTGGTGSGGGTPMENVSPLERPMDPMRDVPKADLPRVDDLKEWLPKVPALDEGLRPEELDTVTKIDKLNEDLRKALLDGMNKKKGSGKEDGTGQTGTQGGSSGTTGDATSSANRSVRWELIFKTQDGRDYLRQLQAMKATLVIPELPAWKNSKTYKDLTSPIGVAFNMDEMPGLYFIDDSADSGSKIARALGLNYDPPLFIAFFPKEIEEELAAKERGFRNRKESEIFSTKFKVLIRDGKSVITVVDQVPVKR